MSFGHQDADIIVGVVAAIAARQAANATEMSMVNATASNNANMVQTNIMQGTTQEVVPDYIASQP